MDRTLNHKLKIYEIKRDRTLKTKIAIPKQTAKQPETRRKTERKKKKRKKKRKTKKDRAKRLTTSILKLTGSLNSTSFLMGMGCFDFYVLWLIQVIERAGELLESSGKKRKEKERETRN